MFFCCRGERTLSFKVLTFSSIVLKVVLTYYNLWSIPFLNSDIICSIVDFVLVILSSMFYRSVSLSWFNFWVRSSSLTWWDSATLLIDSYILNSWSIDNLDKSSLRSDKPWSNFESDWQIESRILSRDSFNSLSWASYLSWKL